MNKAYQYQDSFDDDLAKEFREILSITPSFDPQKYGEVELWLDADDPSSITLSSGKISNWQSKIVNISASQGANLNQPEYVQNALAGRAALRFLGNQWLVMNNASFLQIPATIFVVCKVNNPATVSSQTIISRQSGANNGGVMFRKSGSSASNMEVQQVDTASPYPTAAEAIDSSWHIYCASVYIDSAPSISKNGTLPVVSANIPSGFVNDSNLPAAIGVAAFNYSASQFSGDLAEILIYQESLATDKITEILLHLSEKWEIVI